MLQVVWDGQGCLPPFLRWGTLNWRSEGLPWFINLVEAKVRTHGTVDKLLKAVNPYYYLHLGDAPLSVFIREFLLCPVLNGKWGHVHCQDRPDLLLSYSEECSSRASLDFTRNSSEQTVSWSPVVQNRSPASVLGPQGASSSLWDP